MQKHQKEVNDAFEQRIAALESLTSKQSVEIQKEQEKSTYARTDIDKMNNTLISLKQDFNLFRTDTNAKVSHNQIDLQEQIYATDRYIAEIQNSLNKEINDVRKSSYDMLKATEKELNE
jgi:uncharacterized coiled-coil protein SlyX